MKIDLVGIRGWFFTGSAIAVLISLVLLAIPPALVPGIEFSSGTTALYRFSELTTQEDVRQAYSDLGHSDVRVQSAGPLEFLIRTGELDVPESGFNEVSPAVESSFQLVGPSPIEPIGTIIIGAESATDDVLLRSSAAFACRSSWIGDSGAVGAIAPGTEVTLVDILFVCSSEGDFVWQVQSGDLIGYVHPDDTHDFAETSLPAPDPALLGERAVIEIELETRFGAFEVLEFASVSPVVSSVAVRNAVIAVVVASFFIMAYVAFAFSTLPKPFRYAASAIIALIHDVVIVLGAFSLFGKLLGLEINLMFVTALLTVVGFSVHDSIVVFDRIRENVRLSPNAKLADNVNAALIQTMSRSLNTSLTLLLTVTAMLLLGGESIRAFLLTIFVGVIVGTYSSIGIAAQVLVAWEAGDFRRWLSRAGASSPSRDSSEASDTP
jgi:preprotein translocase SecF subunit